MDWRSHCLTVVPCFNEARALPALLPEVRHHLPHVLVIDDGSSDATAEVASGLGAVVVRQPQNLGKGAALRRGWDYAQRQGFSWVLTLDGDGQHSPSDIPALLARAETSGCDLVVGNRMTDANAMPALRRWTNHWLSRRLSDLLHRDLPDSQCGFRLIRLPLLASVELATDRFEVESEMLVQLALAGARMEFVPVRTIYRDEQSKIHPVRDAWRWWCWWRQARRKVRRAEQTAAAFSPSRV